MATCSCKSDLLLLHLFQPDGRDWGFEIGTLGLGAWGLEGCRVLHICMIDFQWLIAQLVETANSPSLHAPGTVGPKRSIPPSRSRSRSCSWIKEIKQTRDMYCFFLFAFCVFFFFTNLLLIDEPLNGAAAGCSSRLWVHYFSIRIP